MKIYVVERYNSEDSGGYSFIAAYRTFDGSLKYVQSTYKEHVSEDDVAYYHYIKLDKTGIELDDVVHGIPNSNDTRWFRVSCDYRLPWNRVYSRYIITKIDLIED